MKKHLLLACLFGGWSLLPLGAQNIYFPPKTGQIWETLDPAEVNWQTEHIPPLLEFLEANNTKAFLVLKDGKLVMEEYFHGFGQDSIWYWASAGKSLRAFLVGIAQEQGYLSLEDPASLYLGEGWTALPSEQEEKITIRHQLTMTSGLDDQAADHHCTLDTCLQFEAEAGQRWAYHNAPYTLLKEVLETATGQMATLHFWNTVGSKTGMTGAWIQTGYNNIFFSTPRTMARYGLLVLNQGIWEGELLLQDQQYFQQMITPSQELNPSYGYLWWLNGQSTYMLPGLQFRFPGPLFPEAPHDMIAALGKNGQILDIVPSQGLVIVRMGETPGQDVEVPALLNNELWKYLNPIINQPTAIAAPSSPAGWRLTSNPVGDQLRLVHPAGHKTIKGTIMDAFGRRLQSIVQVETDVSNLPPGMYFLYLIEDETPQLLKWIKQ